MERNVLNVEKFIQENLQTMARPGETPQEYGGNANQYRINHLNKILEIAYKNMQVCTVGVLDTDACLMSLSRGEIFVIPKELSEYMVEEFSKNFGRHAAFVLDTCKNGAQAKIRARRINFDITNEAGTSMKLSRPEGKKSAKAFYSANANTLNKTPDLLSAKEYVKFSLADIRPKEVSDETIFQMHLAVLEKCELNMAFAINADDNNPYTNDASERSEQTQMDSAYFEKVKETLIYYFGENDGEYFFDLIMFKLGLIFNNERKIKVSYNKNEDGSYTYFHEANLEEVIHQWAIAHQVSTFDGEPEKPEEEPTHDEACEDDSTQEPDEESEKPEDEPAQSEVPTSDEAHKDEQAQESDVETKASEEEPSSDPVEEVPQKEVPEQGDYFDDLRHYLKEREQKNSQNPSGQPQG